MTIFRMRTFVVGAFAAMTIALPAFPAMTAAAATTHGTSCVIETLSSKTYTRVNPKNHRSFTSTIQLRYNSCTRMVWAKELGQQIPDHLWVYNRDTKQTRSANFPHVATASLNDAGTYSHACMDNGTPDYLRMVKTCTAYE